MEWDVAGHPLRRCSAPCDAACHLPWAGGFEAGTTAVFDSGIVPTSGRLWSQASNEIRASPGRRRYRVVLLELRPLRARFPAAPRTRDHARCDEASWAQAGWLPPCRRPSCDRGSPSSELTEPRTGRRDRLRRMLVCSTDRGFHERELAKAISPGDLRGRIESRDVDDALGRHGVAASCRRLLARRFRATDRPRLDRVVNSSVAPLRVARRFRSRRFSFRGGTLAAPRGRRFARESTARSHYLRESETRSARALRRTIRRYRADGDTFRESRLRAREPLEWLFDMGARIQIVYALGDPDPTAAPSTLSRGCRETTARGSGYTPRVTAIREAAPSSGRRRRPRERYRWPGRLRRRAATRDAVARPPRLPTLTAGCSGKPVDNERPPSRSVPTAPSHRHLDRAALRLFVARQRTTTQDIV